ncbi:OmpP1/FadL family transporter [Halopseudomonas phragmitis]|uniref:Long-chain fatty acid transport protein n=1 Tax=Halopseudomonas phragmitis TaxID=1931241 RepID=A0A1V0B7E5_9GAMM|nr:outer membrane protein transport protein [Halopseudomonas phragmitis]AQZ95856.1 Long-chain fatty acid transport protein [Halopseudomonas phragmitis]
MFQRVMKTCLAVAVASASSQALANGLAINEQSASGAGTAFAGRSSSALDSSTIYGNPAGLARLKRAEVSGGIAMVKADVDISNVNSTAQGSNKGDMVPLAHVPFGYYAKPINDEWAFGLGVYVPFGVISDYEKSFQGSSHGLYSSVRVVTIQPTVSYAFNDRVSIGFGPTFNRIDGKLTNTLATSQMGAPSDTLVNIKGDDTAMGFNVGIMASLTDRTTVGATYHSKVKYQLEGRTKISGSPMGMFDGEMDAKLDITMPESLDLSVTHQLDDRWTLYAGGVWTRWSRLEGIEARNSNPVSPRFTTISEELNWENTWSFSVGTAYQLNPQWVLRSGLALDPSPTSNAHRNVRIPVGNRKIFTLGAGWSPNADVTLDLAYAYLWENTASVHQKAGSEIAPGVLLKQEYNAKYDNSAHGLTAQLTYRF